LPADLSRAKDGTLDKRTTFFFSFGELLSALSAREVVRAAPAGFPQYHFRRSERNRRITSMKDISRRNVQPSEAAPVSLQIQNRVETNRRIPLKTVQDAEADFAIGALIAAYLRPPAQVSSCFYCL
jgi:hypothetical protein